MESMTHFPVYAGGAVFLVFLYCLVQSDFAAGMRDFARKRRFADELKRWRQKTHVPEIAGAREFRRRDPAFDPDAFLGRAKAAFAKVAECGWNRDYAAARPFLSDGLAEALSLRLRLEQADGLGLERAEIEFQKPSILRIDSDRLFDAVHVNFSGRERVDRVRSQSNGSEKGESARFSRIWTFVRRPGKATSGAPGLIEGFCPSCGAPASLPDAGLCAHCRCWLNSGEHDWVITKARDATRFAWSSPPENKGLALLGQADPEANVLFLEDRALIVFWRWQLALALKDASPLRSVTLDRAYSAVESDVRAAAAHRPGVVLQELSFDSFRFGKTLDRATFRVGWTSLEPDGKGRPRDGLALIELARRVGSLTAARSGLCSARCPQCGAAPYGRDEERCSYCSASFIDGAHHWALSRLTPAD